MPSLRKTFGSHPRRSLACEISGHLCFGSSSGKSSNLRTDLEFEITDLFYNELLLSSLLPVKASFEPFSKPYNNIKINFDQWLFGVEELSQKQRVWCAATSINAVANMHNLCLQENINIPPYLDIFLISKCLAGCARFVIYQLVRYINTLYNS